MLQLTIGLHELIGHGSSRLLYYDANEQTYNFNKESLLSPID